MIKKEKVTVYQIVCDRCGQTCEDDECVAWADEESARDFARENDWHEIDGKLYCPDCVDYDEEKGEYVPKKPLKQE